MQMIPQMHLIPPPPCAPIHAGCTTKQTLTTVSATQSSIFPPPPHSHHSPCHIAQDVGADHHASPAPHLFPFLLQPLLQGLLQEHLREEQRHGRQGVTQTQRDTEKEVEGERGKKWDGLVPLPLGKAVKEGPQRCKGPLLSAGRTPCPLQRKLWCS